ncbi:hypothetical protein BYT27DRAFT_7227977 [Phlegmacium glaucopus]|nr:hypothetical protein BYT27DRAFT_7227977 [Phlegmacium glaucopus]
MAASAHWSGDAVIALLNFVLSKKATAGDGMSFKTVVWNEAATIVNQIPRVKGGLKTSGSCKNKFAKLKETFHIVAAIKAQSGFKWDDKKGADIGPESEAVWEAYEKKNKGASAFKNKGWPWYDRMLPLMPTAPRGANTYQPISGSQLSQPISNWSPSPPPEDRTASKAAEDFEDEPRKNQKPPETPNVKTGVKRRQSALQVGEASSSNKRQRGFEARPSGALALHGMREGLEEFTEVFHDVMTGKKSNLDATPIQKSMAMKWAQELETDLSDRCNGGRCIYVSLS